MDRVVDTSGHTPSHSSVLATDLEGDGHRSVLILGGIMRCKIQLPKQAGT